MPILPLLIFDQGVDGLSAHTPHDGMAAVGVGERAVGSRMFPFAQIVGLFVSAEMQHGCEVIDSVRGEGIFDGQDAGPNHSSFRPGFGLGDIQVLGS